MNIQVRPLTVPEETAFVLTYGDIQNLPPWGAVYTSSVGKVLVFDGADNRRRFMVLSGPDSDYLAAQINKSTYSSPGAGLVAFLEDVTTRTVDMGASILKLMALVSLVMFLSNVRNLTR